MTLVELKDARAVATRYPLATAFVLSLVIHLGLYQFWITGKRLGWWQQQATWLLNWHKKSKPSKLILLADRKVAARMQAQPRAREIPLTFVDVDPSTVSPAPPKESKYYGQRNSVASNPDATLETVTPKVDGKQDKMVRLQDVPKPMPFPLQPAPPQPKPAPVPVEPAPKPKPADTPGDLAKALLNELKRQPEPKADFGTGTAAQRERPRTVAEARLQQGLVGQTMKQAGGVAARGRIALDVTATPFGAYDAAFIEAVQECWYAILDRARFTQHSGKVVLEFRLTVDGRITNMRMLHNEVGELQAAFCQRAVQDPAPYARWPNDMRRVIGADYREVTFTFHYY